MFVFGGGDGGERRFKDLYVLEDRKKWLSGSQQVLAPSSEAPAQSSVVLPVPLLQPYSNFRPSGSQTSRDDELQEV